MHSGRSLLRPPVLSFCTRCFLRISIAAIRVQRPVAVRRTINVTPSTPTSGLAAIAGLRAASSVPQAAAPAAVPRPHFRWTTRILLPAAILAAAAGLLAYSAREMIRPTIPVHVVPVVVREPVLDDADAAEEASGEEAGVSEPARGADTLLAQAPGWVEPDPYAINVAALTEGVIKEVLVLEGHRVESGQVVARLIDEDAVLMLRRAEAELEQARAAVAAAEARVASAEARTAEVREELTRRRPLLGTGAVSDLEIANFERRLATAERETLAAQAEVAAARAAVATHEVVCDEARLRLARTQIVAPAGGVVLARLVEPGMRIAMAPPGAGEPLEPGIIRLYDPSHIQVRVDVPLADAARIMVGTRAEVTTEALPDTIFRGRVTRVVHQADIQRNTVQFKVAIESPSEVLKPEMLTRVRFYGRGAGQGGATAMAGAEDASGLRLIAPETALFNRSEQRAAAWVAEQSVEGARAAERSITLGGRPMPGHVEVLAGLRAGDRLIVDPPPGLHAGARLRILGEAPSADSTADHATEEMP